MSADDVERANRAQRLREQQIRDEEVRAARRAEIERQRLARAAELERQTREHQRGDK